MTQPSIKSTHTSLVLALGLRDEVGIQRVTTIEALGSHDVEVSHLFKWNVKMGWSVPSIRGGIRRGSSSLEWVDRQIHPHLPLLVASMNGSLGTPWKAWKGVCVRACVCLFSMATQS